MASKNKKIFNASHGLVMTFQPGANLKMVSESPHVMLYKNISQSNSSVSVNQRPSISLITLTSK